MIQWAWLPTHRTAEYEFEILARSPGLTRLSVSVAPADEPAGGVSIEVGGLGPEWRTLRGHLRVAGRERREGRFLLSVASPEKGQFVVRHIFLRPADHAATVNHGGGLRKEHERVYANPCHTLQSGFAAFAGATPVAVEIEASERVAPRVLPELRNATKEAKYASIDAFAAITADGDLLVSLVNRRAEGPTRVTLDVGGFSKSGTAEAWIVGGDTPAAGNSLEHPDAIVEKAVRLDVSEGKVVVEFPAFSAGRVRVRKG